MTSESPTQIGRRAEDAAADFLQKQGLVPAARNWRRRSAEIDLVMRDGDEWVFVEVRRRDRWRDAAESVDENKRRRIVRAAAAFWPTPSAARATTRPAASTRLWWTTAKKFCGCATFCAWIHKKNDTMRVMTQARSHLHSDSVSGSGLIRSRESGNRSGSRSDSAPVVRSLRAGFARRFRPGMAALFFALPLLGGCPAAIVAGGAGGALVANDQRTAGALLEDEVIEIKARAELRRQLGDAVNVEIVSYNRRRCWWARRRRRSCWTAPRRLCAGLRMCAATR